MHCPVWSVDCTGHIFVSAGLLVGGSIADYFQLWFVGRFLLKL